MCNVLNLLQLSRSHLVLFHSLLPAQLVDTTGDNGLRAYSPLGSEAEGGGEGRGERREREEERGEGGGVGGVVIGVVAEGEGRGKRKGLGLL